MNKIKHIKPFYEPAEVQDILREDSIKIFAKNLTATFQRYKKRNMTEKEVDRIVKLVYSELNRLNDMDDFNRDMIS